MDNKTPPMPELPEHYDIYAHDRMSISDEITGFDIVMSTSSSAFAAIMESLWRMKADGLFELYRKSGTGVKFDDVQRAENNRRAWHNEFQKRLEFELGEIKE